MMVQKKKESYSFDFVFLYIQKYQAKNNLMMKHRLYFYFLNKGTKIFPLKNNAIYRFEKKTKRKKIISLEKKKTLEKHTNN